jgi:hypothetical protein
MKTAVFSFGLILFEIIGTDRVFGRRRRDEADGGRLRFPAGFGSLMQEITFSSF